MRLVEECIFPKYLNNVNCKIMDFNRISYCACEYVLKKIDIISLSSCDIVVKAAVNILGFN